MTDRDLLLEFVEWMPKLDDPIDAEDVDIFLASRSPTGPVSPPGKEARKGEGSALLSLLKKLEWAGKEACWYDAFECGTPECPCCDQRQPGTKTGKPEGHAPDCDLAAAIKRLEGETAPEDPRIAMACGDYLRGWLDGALDGPANRMLRPGRRSPDFERGYNDGQTAYINAEHQENVRRGADPAVGFYGADPMPKAPHVKVTEVEGRYRRIENGVPCLVPDPGHGGVTLLLDDDLIPDMGTTDEYDEPHRPEEGPRGRFRIEVSFWPKEFTPQEKP